MDFLPLILGVVGLGVAFFFAERSLRRQQGSGIKRTREEELALSRAQTDAARGAGPQGF